MVYGQTAKKLARCLVDVIFPDVKLLATCSAFGQKSNVTKLTRAALPSRKVHAIIGNDTFFKEIMKYKLLKLDDFIIIKNTMHFQIHFYTETSFKLETSFKFEISFKNNA